MGTYPLNVLVRQVIVHPMSSVMDALRATNRTLYVVEDILASAPRGLPGVTKVSFFQAGKWVEDDELAEVYKDLGLRPADVDSLIAVNSQDPGFAVTYANATHWLRGNEWCYMAFRTRLGQPAVTANPNYMMWQDFWWYAGVPK